MTIEILFGVIRLVGLLGIAGCVATPAISDIRSDVVKVQVETDIIYSHRPETVRREAERGCAEYGNVISHALSQRCIRPGGFGVCMITEYLFACKKPGTQPPMVPFTPTN